MRVALHTKVPGYKKPCDFNIGVFTMHISALLLHHDVITEVVLHIIILCGLLGIIIHCSSNE